MVDVICGWEKIGIKMDFLQVLPYVFLILFLPAWGHPISYLPSWEILDGFPGFTLEGVDPSPPLRLIPNNFYWDCPLLMTCVKPLPRYFLSIQFLCLLVLLNFLSLKLSCLFSYIFCFISNILKVLRRWNPWLSYVRCYEHLMWYLVNCCDLIHICWNFLVFSTWFYFFLFSHLHSLANDNSLACIFHHVPRNIYKYRVVFSLAIEK